MADDFSIHNLDAVLQKLGATQQQLMKAAEYALAECAKLVVRTAKKNADTGSHPRGKGHIPGTGPGPNRVSGRLRNSIDFHIVSGFPHYTAVVGASAEYARAVELGLEARTVMRKKSGKTYTIAGWKQGGYPFLRPAVEASRATIQATFNRALAAAIARG